MNIERIPITALVLVLVGACGDGAEQTRPSSAPPSTAAPAVATRDFASIEACQLVTQQEVAEITGGTLATTESSWTGPHCMYVIDVASGTEGYVLHIGSADEMALSIDYLDVADRGEPVTGPWKEAYLRPKELGEGMQVVVLERGDFAIEVNGDARRDPIVEIARRAYDRVKRAEMATYVAPE